MINAKLAKEVIDACLGTGGDFAEIYSEDSYKSYITVENGKVDASVEATVNGCGIRILKGLRSVYGHTNDISRKNLIALATNLSKSFLGERELEASDFTLVKHKNNNKKIRSYKDVTDEEIVTLLKDANGIISSYDPRIVKTNTSFLRMIQDVTIYNSKGNKFTDHREHGRLIMMAVAFENGKVETFTDLPGTQKGFEFFTDEVNYKFRASEVARKVILMLGAKECPAGKFPVVIGNGWGGVIFHEACGHQMEATSVAKGLSVYAPLYGQKIGSDIVNAYDDGTMANEWGSINIDDEGNPAQKNLLIENGVLKGYLIDPFGARRMPGFTQNGCSRRESYKYEPTSRMTNTYIANGKSTKEEIIAATKLGIYAVSFQGGSVNPSTGEFQFGCSEAYLIKDGKIGEPLRGATLIGKATEVLHHIDMIANDLDLGQGNCGSASGSIPVNVGQPTIRVDEITVGGRGGDINEL